MKLDKSKPHFTVFGDDNGRAFEQDGKFFNGDGTLWTEPEGEGEATAKPAVARKVAAKKPAAAPKAAPAVKSEAEQQVDDQLSGQ